jgi:hypothetical protein
MEKQIVDKFNKKIRLMRMKENKSTLEVIYNEIFILLNKLIIFF